MDTVCLITIIGTLASIGGATLSVWQAKKSKKSADEAKRVRSQLNESYKSRELAQLQALCRRAQKSMEKYGPASNPTNLLGVSPQNEAKDVQEIILLIKENRTHFGSKTPNEADQFCETLNPLLERFANSTTNEELIINGKPILFYLNSMASIIKNHIDSKTSKIC